MTSFDLGMLGIGLAAAAAGTSLGAALKRPLLKLLLPLAALTLLFVPFGDLRGVGYVRGVVSELSITSMVLLGVGLVKRAGGPALRSAERPAVLAPVVAGAFFLYPTALGLTKFDAYALGYGREGLVVVFALLGAAAALLGFRLLPLALAGSLAAFGLGLGESQNLWDYGIDPWLALYAVGWVGRRFTKFVPLSKSR